MLSPFHALFDSPLMGAMESSVMWITESLGVVEPRRLHKRACHAQNLECHDSDVVRTDSLRQNVIGVIAIAFGISSVGSS